MLWSLKTKTMVCKLKEEYVKASLSINVWKSLFISSSRKWRCSESTYWWHGAIKWITRVKYLCLVFNKDESSSEEINCGLINAGLFNKGSATSVVNGVLSSEDFSPHSWKVLSVWCWGLGHKIRSKAKFLATEIDFLRRGTRWDREKLRNHYKILKSFWGYYGQRAQERTRLIWRCQSHGVWSPLQEDSPIELRTSEIQRATKWQLELWNQFQLNSSIWPIVSSGKICNWVRETASPIYNFT